MMIHSSVQQMKTVYAAGVKLGKRLASFRGEDRPILRRFTKNFSISFGGSLVSIVIGLGRTALLTKSLVIADYGKILIVINLFTFLGSFLGVRVNDVIYRFYPQFEQEKDIGALRGLLFLCLALSMAVGLTLGGGVFVLAPWIADRFYQDASLAPLWRIYAGAVLISAFGGVYIPILRLHDRFPAVVIPQVLGGAVTLAVLGGYFYSADGYHLEPVVAAFAVGVVVRTVFPLIQAMRIVSPYLFTVQWKLLFPSLRKYRHELVSTLFQTNLAGYLKLVFSPGDVFLLGIFSTPTQVALYGLARSLTSPLLTLQNNLQTAVTPEVVSLWAQRKLKQLKRLVRNYVAMAFIIGSIGMVAVVLLVRPIILWISKPEYLEAIPIFCIIIVVVWVTLMFAHFYPLGLSMGMLQRHNLANIVGAILLFFVIMFLELRALELAVLQLIIISVWVVVFCYPVWKRLWKLFSEERSLV